MTRGSVSDTKHLNFVAHLTGFQSRFEKGILILNRTCGREDICASDKNQSCKIQKVIPMKILNKYLFLLGFHCQKILGWKVSNEFSLENVHKQVYKVNEHFSLHF